MDYNIINNSILYYQLKGFKYIDVPWLVYKEALVTIPKNLETFNIVRDKHVVGSAEQSFIQMMLDDKLPKGRYCTATPCFRDEVEDDIHQTYFMKTELIDTLSVNKESLHEIIQICLEFFIQYVKGATIIETGLQTFDIIDSKTNIELGSYGIRSYKGFSWIYATGVAVPRISYVVNQNSNPGYHNIIIPKGNVGSFNKVVEEFEELKDAVLQNNKLLTLCELSDMIGAIEMYAQNIVPGINFQDLLQMKDLTKRAFENGKR